MKKNLIFSALILLCLGAFAQDNVNVKLGTEYDVPKRSTISKILGYDDTGFYTLSSNGFFGNKISLDFLDKNMMRVNSAEIELETDGKDRYMEEIIHTNNTLYLFSSFINQKQKKKFLFMETIDKKTLKPNNNLKKIAEIEYDSKYNSGSFNFIFSTNKERILLFYHLPYEENQPEKFAFHVYDSKMNEVWTKNISLPYSDKLCVINSYIISNNGDVYLTAKLYKDKIKETRGGEINYKHIALCYYSNQETPKEYTLALNGKYVTDIKVAVNNSNDIVCAGFYSEEGTYSIKGAFYMLIDGNSKQIKKETIKEFTIDFITMEMSERQAEKTKKRAEKGKDVELYEYDLDDLVMREDGGVVLIGEQFYTRTHTYTTTNSNGSTTTHRVTYYYYNDIIVINIAPNGNIQWATKIPKYQVSSNDGGFYSSYTKGIGEDRLLFVYNDNPKNLLPNQEKQYNFNAGQESAVVCAEVDKNGKVTKRALFSSSEAEIITRPKVSDQINENSLLIFGQKKKKQRFAMMTF